MAIRFDEMELLPELLRAVDDLGYTEATPIQEKVIPVMLEERDVIGQAQTGTGKTAAFGLPLLQKVGPGVKKTQALILCPTRELAMQISKELHDYSKYMHGVKILPVYGGTDMGRQIKALKGVQIIVGTPGRIMDHLKRHTIKCEFIQTIILDEADEMLDMGFREDIEKILEYIPENHQTALFSATMPKGILDITKKYQQPDAVQIKTIKKELTVSAVEQYYYDIRNRDKTEVLMRLLDVYDPRLALVFCNTKKMTQSLTDLLKERGYAADGLHGDLKQQQRDDVMNAFRRGDIRILVATDVAARGLDVENVEAVFNYDLPQDNEFYVHRIGRTGRAGHAGKAFSLIRRKEYPKLQEIQKFCKTKILEQAIPTWHDVEEARCDRVMEQVESVLKQYDLTETKQMIRHMTADGQITELDVAAALLYQILGREEDK